MSHWWIIAWIPYNYFDLYVTFDLCALPNQVINKDLAEMQHLQEERVDMNAELEEVIFNDAFSYRDHVSELEHTCYFICEKQKLEVKMILWMI